MKQFKNLKHLRETKMNLAPSHQNSTNERRERRANAKADARTTVDPQERLQNVAKALFEMGCVTRNGQLYTITMPKIGSYSRTFTVTDSDCSCLEYGLCEHKLSVQIYRAQEEVEDRYNSTGVSILTEPSFETMHGL